MFINLRNTKKIHNPLVCSVILYFFICLPLVKRGGGQPGKDGRCKHDDGGSDDEVPVEDDSEGDDADQGEAVEQQQPVIHDGGALVRGAHCVLTAQQHPCWEETHGDFSGENKGM